MRQNRFKLVCVIKFVFLFFMINYSQKTLIDHGFMASKKLFQIFIKIKRMFIILKNVKKYSCTRTRDLDTRTQF